MSRTFRLRHLPQPEGGRLTRRFVDSSVRFPVDHAEETFLSHLAHVVLKLPCKLKGGPAVRDFGWRTTHARCLPPDTHDALQHARPDWYRLGWTRVLHKGQHSFVGYGLACVPSANKKTDRKLVYRRHRRHAKRLLRVVKLFRYLDEGTCRCSEPFCDLGGVPEYRYTNGTEFDPDLMNFEAKSIKAGLRRSAFALTW